MLPSSSGPLWQTGPHHKCCGWWCFRIRLIGTHNEYHIKVPTYNLPCSALWKYTPNYQMIKCNSSSPPCTHHNWLLITIDVSGNALIWRSWGHGGGSQETCGTKHDVRHQWPVLLTWFNFNPSMDHMSSKVAHGITYPFLNFNGCTVEV